MEKEVKRYYSVNEMNKRFGIPVTMMRREIKAGCVPGFYSGSWFHIDSTAYLEILSRRTERPSD